LETVVVTLKEHDIGLVAEEHVQGHAGSARAHTEIVVLGNKSARTVNSCDDEMGDRESKHDRAELGEIYVFEVR